MHTSTTTNDNYYGSGKVIKRSVAKYGKENHRKEILELCDSREEMIEREKQIVNEDFVANPLTMNLCLGGKGGGWTREQQREFNRRSQVAQRKLEKTDPDWVNRRNKNISKAQKDMWARGLGPCTLKPHPIGHKLSEETKRKISVKASKRQKGTGNNMFGLRWVCDPSTIQNKLVKQSEIDYWMSCGWVRGKITEHNRRQCMFCDAYFRSRREAQFCSKRCCAEFTKRENMAAESTNINMILNSNIDFSKYGWCAKVASLLDKDVMTIKRWMLRCMPEFYERCCYKRSK